MGKIDGGGQAFPTARVTINGETATDGVETYGPGLTKREYFASTSCSLPDNTHVKFAEALVGRKEPEDKTDYLAIAKFWAEADAVYRVLYADALIASLEGGA